MDLGGTTWNRSTIINALLIDSKPWKFQSRRLIFIGTLKPDYDIDAAYTEYGVRNANFPSGHL